jgi:hypothetical protein
MSPPEEPRSQTSEEKAGQAEALFEQRFDHLMEEFSFTGDVEVLKAFIKRGGDIDQYNLRDIIADLIGGKPGPNPGGAKTAINIAFYMAVNARRNRMKSTKRLAAPKCPTLQDQLLSLRKVGKTATIEEIAAEWSAKGRGVSYEGGRTRYERGKKLFKQKFGRVWN